MKAQPVHPIVAAADMVVASIEAAMTDAVDTQASKQVIAQLAVCFVQANRLTGLLLEASDHPRIYADEIAKPATTFQQQLEANKPLPPARAAFEYDQAVANALPKLQKQPKDYHKDTSRPGIKQQYKSASEFICPSCKAEPGTRCFVMTGPGSRSVPTDQRRDDDWWHRSRTKLASDHNEAVRFRYDREHFNDTPAP